MLESVDVRTHVISIISWMIVHRCDKNRANSNGHIGPNMVLSTRHLISKTYGTQT